MNPPTRDARRVYDRPTRLFHGLLALSVAIAWLTGDASSWRVLHVSLGYGVLLLLAWRLLWGGLGPTTRTHGAMLARVRALRPTWQRWTAGFQGTMASPMVGALVALSAVLLMSLPGLAALAGVLTYFDVVGRWIKEVHELLGNLVLVVVIAHLALLLMHSLLRHRNLLWPMLSGRLTEPGPDLIRSPGTDHALVLAALMAGFWGSFWQLGLDRHPLLNPAYEQLHPKRSHHAAKPSPVPEASRIDTRPQDTM
jgi:cytochrome b